MKNTLVWIVSTDNSTTCCEAPALYPAKSLQSIKTQQWIRVVTSKLGEKTRLIARDALQQTLVCILPESQQYIAAGCSVITWLNNCSNGVTKTCAPLFLKTSQHCCGPMPGTGEQLTS